METVSAHHESQIVRTKNRLIIHGNGIIPDDFICLLDLLVGFFFFFLESWAEVQIQRFFKLPVNFCNLFRIVGYIGGEIGNAELFFHHLRCLEGNGRNNEIQSRGGHLHKGIKIGVICNICHAIAFGFQEAF